MSNVDTTITNFKYVNKTGNTEVVSLKPRWVSLSTEWDDVVSDIYIEDIPKLIEALQAAYDYQTTGNK